ncbi:hypothetical protein ABB02_00360 [Clostridiaceae bacterium JG1575]|nr:hypothetical protein ABB02_00360 [Clostridiaceae bacterium JG1575]
MNPIDEQKQQEISRRSFLKTSAKAVAGAAAVSATQGLYRPQLVFAQPKPKQKLTYEFKKPQADAMPSPMPYPGLDPVKAQERAYKAYKEKGG